MVLREQPNKPILETHIASLLIRIAKMYQIPNFDEESALILAVDTIERFQYDPVDVLVKCLTKPPHTGQKNWRLTPDTISEWMAITLETEADNLEREHRKAKSVQLEFEVPQDISIETQKKIQDYIDSLSGFQKIAPLPDDYIKEYGQRNPKKVSHSSGFLQPSREKVIENRLRIEWMKESFNHQTAERLPDSLSFDEWILR